MISYKYPSSPYYSRSIQPHSSERSSFLLNLARQFFVRQTVKVPEQQYESLSIKTVLHQPFIPLLNHFCFNKVKVIRLGILTICLTPLTYLAYLKIEKLVTLETMKDDNFSLYNVS